MRRIPEFPGQVDYDKGHQLLAEARAAKGDPPKDKLEQAVTAFGNAISKNPVYGTAFFDRANARQLLGDTDKAIDDYTEAISLNPERANTCYGRGVAYLEKGLRALAIADLTEAIRLAPTRTKPYVGVLAPGWRRENTPRPSRMPKGQSS